jgi:hypothetical protein
VDQQPGPGQGSRMDSKALSAAAWANSTIGIDVSVAK